MPALIPLPRRVVMASGELQLGGSHLRVQFAQHDTPRLQAAVARFSDGFVGARPVPLTVNCENRSDRHPQLGTRESYRLRVAEAGIELWSDSEWGVMHGLGTLQQLRSDGSALPCCEIFDEPRFAWRGLLVDVARHFISVAALQRTIDGMAACKLNVLHLHLTDDQAFRFPSRSLPIASEPQYAAADLSDLVEYAAQRGIRVVPEIDMPGHVTALLAEHPHLGSAKTEKTRRFGVHEGCLDPSKESVYAAIRQLLVEVAEVFPDRYLHIGGDEVSPGWWGENPEIAAFMSAQGIANVAALQSYFVNRVAEIVRSLGREPIGWDEVLHRDVAAPMAVQVWRGASARDAALRSGHSCIVSANYYLDLFFPADVHYGFDPQAPMAELIAREDALLSDARLLHVAPGMRWTHQWRAAVATGEASDDPGAILGGEACLWTELVTEPLLDVRLWSRLPAIAERFWSSADVRDVASLYARLIVWLDRLKEIAGIDVMGRSHELLRAAGVTDRWMPLVELLEPTKWYARLLGEEALRARLTGTEMPQARPYDTDSPLNGVVDGLLPESLATRDVAGLCERASAGDAAARSKLADMAQRWRGFAGRADCLPELTASADQLSLVGEHLACYLGGELSAEATLAELRALDVPRGEYYLAVLPVLCGWLERVQE